MYICTELIVLPNAGTAAGRGFSAYLVARRPRFLPTFVDYNIITYRFPLSVFNTRVIYYSRFSRHSHRGLCAKTR